jgi:formamidopyrimidine-DNA glycosylase
VPELPETETIARDLNVAVRGATIVAALVHRADVLRQVTATQLVARVRGAAIAAVWRRAKCIVLDLSTGDRVVVTPRFTGALLIESGPMRVDEKDYTVLQFRLDDGRTLRYRDVRRLGTVAIVAPDRFSAWSAAIGPEPFSPELTPERFSVLVRSSQRAIKTILMDQKRLAGIGNIYANEALWRARIRPGRRGGSITRAESATLLTEIRAVLARSIELRGTSFRDYVDAFGAKGGFVAELQVYGREGASCTRCGATLVGHHKLEGRITVFCRECQS